jgi:hypothetical protein
MYTHLYNPMFATGKEAADSRPQGQPSCATYLLQAIQELG